MVKSGIDLGDVSDDVEERRQYRDDEGRLQTRTRSEVVRELIRAGVPAVEWIEANEEYPNPRDLDPRELEALVRSAFQALEREERE